jgi:hypothetical protein
MRYLSSSFILTATVLSTLACGDSGGTDAEETAGTGTASETATGDGDGDGGDGDGDGDGGDGDGDGDGDGGDGDGDGDGDGGDGDGDGDGDGGDGDGDGDAGCPQLGNTECDACSAENCCDELMACQADADCSCLSDCIAQGAEIVMCLQMCNIEPNMMMNPLLMDLRECRNTECMQACAMP